MYRLPWRTRSLGTVRIRRLSGGFWTKLSRIFHSSGSVLLIHTVSLDEWIDLCPMRTAGHWVLCRGHPW